MDVKIVCVRAAVWLVMWLSRIRRAGLGRSWEGKTFSLRTACETYADFVFVCLQAVDRSTWEGKWDDV
jgi:hypothetical protein